MYLHPGAVESDRDSPQNSRRTPFGQQKSTWSALGMLCLGGATLLGSITNRRPSTRSHQVAQRDAKRHRRGRTIKRTAFRSAPNVTTPRGKQKVRRPPGGQPWSEDGSPQSGLCRDRQDLGISKSNETRTVTPCVTMWKALVAGKLSPQVQPTPPCGLVSQAAHVSAFNQHPGNSDEQKRGSTVASAYAKRQQDIKRQPQATTHMVL